MLPFFIENQNSILWHLHFLFCYWNCERMIGFSFDIFIQILVVSTLVWKCFHTDKAEVHIKKVGQKKLFKLKPELTKQCFKEEISNLKYTNQNTIEFLLYSITAIVHTLGQNSEKSSLKIHWNNVNIKIDKLSIKIFNGF